MTHTNTKSVSVPRIVKENAVSFLSVNDFVLYIF